MSYTTKAASERVLRYIADHGPDNPVRAADVERRCGVAGPLLRNIVSGARKRGLPIISSAKGYSWAETPEQLEGTLKSLKRRVHNINEVIIGLELAQQMMSRKIRREKVIAGR